MKKSVLVLFGGRSSEHDVSLKSATTILNNMDKYMQEKILNGGGGIDE